MIANPLFRLLIILAMSLLLKATLPKKLRDFLVPLCFAYMIARPNIIPFVDGGLHFAIMALYWVAMAILCDGFDLKVLRQNPVLACFLTFWGYLTLTSLWGDYVYYGLLYYVNVLVELILTGYYVGIWAMRTEDGFYRLFRPLAVAGVLSFAYYVKYGFASELDAGGRGKFDSDLGEDFGNNVNAIGLALGPLIACLVVFVMDRPMFRSRGAMIHRWMGLGALVISVYMLLRTGSRNASLAIFPCFYYFWRGGGSRIRLSKRWIMILAVVALTFVAVKVCMEGAEIRSFKFHERGTGFDLDVMSSGRIGEFVQYLKPMRGIDYIIGDGPHKSWFSEGPTVGGCLSVYVTLLRTTGVLGLLLLSVYFLYMSRFLTSRNRRFQMAFLFFAVWAVTGVAEGSNIRRGYTTQLLLGMSLALCTKQKRLVVGMDGVRPPQTWAFWHDGQKEIACRCR